ncbi:YCII domain protein [Hyphomonas neptunium ATCC 15444]|uniref:YCII domain protein n=2 Tax=Hyphomonas TaxID=85 RepID=Q0C275_HYPNA|nr:MULTISPECIES: YciI family protein [Hyphomonas]ABI76203.1 YCII domain protein [Hyphomonas neptunium ATCC 15444]KCZ93120.1 YciI-like protein [Hyphomonas hirschiana VP5]
MTDLYTIFCRDRPGSRPVRMAQLSRHLSHIETVMDRIKLAAPLRDDAGEAFTGALLVITASSIADARAFIEADPYYQAGIWDTVEIDRLGMSAGEWVGGKSW